MVMTEFKQVVIAGDGDLSFGMGVEKNNKVPFLTIRQLLETSEVGANSMEMESIELLTIVFKNLESLDVLEKMCGKVREYLEEQGETFEKQTPWYDEEQTVARMDIIGQNGNEGEHYNK
jgi:hypothetical protein